MEIETQTLELSNGNRYYFVDANENSLEEIAKHNETIILDSRKIWCAVTAYSPYVGNNIMFRRLEPHGTATRILNLAHIVSISSFKKN